MTQVDGESVPGTAIVRRPGARLAEGLTTYLDRQPVDLTRAQRQWHDYVEAFADHGWAINEVDGDDDCPDAVFVEDAAVVFGTTALVAYPGAPERRREVEPVAARLGSLGFDLHHVAAAEGATLDGGDVLKVGSDIYIGIGERTNQAGFEVAARVFGACGAAVHPVENGAALHLKSAVTALPNGDIIGWEPVLPSAGLSSVRPMPEEAGAHVVDLGGGSVLMAAGAPQSADVVKAAGYRPVVVDISEFEKLEGCVTCLSIRLRQFGGAGSQ